MQHIVFSCKHTDICTHHTHSITLLLFIILRWHCLWRHVSSSWGVSWMNYHKAMRTPVTIRLFLPYRMWHFTGCSSTTLTACIAPPWLRCSSSWTWLTLNISSHLIGVRGLTITWMALSTSSTWISYISMNSWATSTLLFSLDSQSLSFKLLFQLLSEAFILSFQLTDLIPLSIYNG